MARRGRQAPAPAPQVQREGRRARVQWNHALERDAGEKAGDEVTNTNRMRRFRAVAAAVERHRVQCWKKQRARDRGHERRAARHVAAAAR